MIPRTHDTRTLNAHQDSTHEANQRTGRSPIVILVVDHEPVRRTAVVGCLTDHGYRVISADDALDAVRICAGHQETISLVITEHEPPQMDGMSLARMLQTVDPRIRIIATTGLSEVHAHWRIFETGIERVIIGPFGERALFEAIDFAFRRPVRHRPEILN